MSSSIGTTTTTTTNNNNASSNATTSTTMTRPIHPCVMNPTTNHYCNRGIEFTTWAYLLPSSSSSSSSPPISAGGGRSGGSTATTSIESHPRTHTHTHTCTRTRTPNLVTASSNTICVYTICPVTQTLQLAASSSSSNNSSFKSVLSHLAGTIVSLSTIPLSSSSSTSTSSFTPDALLIGFAGHPRCVVVTLVPDTDDTEPDTTIRNTTDDSNRNYIGSGNSIKQPQQFHHYRWQVSSMVDMSHILMEYSLGATTIYEQDMIVKSYSTYNNHSRNSDEDDWMDLATTPSAIASSRSSRGGGGGGGTTTAAATTVTTTTGLSTSASTTTSSSSASASPAVASACCILGGGIALAMITFRHTTTTQYHANTTMVDARSSSTGSSSTGSSSSSSSVTADEPYMVPLASLQLPHQNSKNAMNSLTVDPNKQPGTTNLAGADTAASATTTDNASHSHSKYTIGSSIPTGFGEIFDVVFLHGYRTDPVIVILHSTSKHGKIGANRYNKTKNSTTTESSDNDDDDDNCNYYYYYCTALSISTIHQRTAILWSVPIPSMDVLYLSIPPPSSSSFSTNNNNNNNNCFVVVANNTITFMSSTDGSIQQCIAVNGWAGASSSGSVVSSNPIMKLSIQLDGCQITWMTCTFGFIVLRYGQVYTIQYISSSSSQQCIGGGGSWAILPLGQQFTAIGEIATCCNISTAMSSSPTSSSFIREGYILAGSRLGNSLWLQFTVESVPVPNFVEQLMMQQHSKKPNHEHNRINDVDTTIAIRDGTISILNGSQTIVDCHMDGDNNDDAVDEILRIEDEALYGSEYLAEDGTRPPDVIPPSDDDDDQTDDVGNTSGIGTRRASTRSIRNGTSSTKYESKVMGIVRSLRAVDCIVNVGPLGPSCSGPIDRAPMYLLQNNHLDDDAADSSDVTSGETIYGAVAEIYPSGYGSSGGIAYMTVPGRDDRMIISETDCLHTECLFTLPHHGFVLIGMSHLKGSSGGIRILKQYNNDGSSAVVGEMKEIYIEEWCSETVGAGNTSFADSWEMFQSTLLCAGEYASGQRVVLVVKTRETMETSVLLAQYNTTIEKMEVTRHHRIDLPLDHPMANKSVTVTNVCPITDTTRNDVGSASFGCIWSNGDATLVSINSEGAIVTTWIEGTDLSTTNTVKDEMDVDHDDDNDDAEEKEIDVFYRNTSIVAIDVFHAPFRAFESPTAMNTSSATTMTMHGTSHDAIIVPEIVASSIQDSSATTTSWYNSYDDAEDEELYSIRSIHNSTFSKNTLSNEASDPPPSATGEGTVDTNVIGTYVAVCRKLGSIDIYAITDLNNVVWTIRGTNLGLSTLTGVPNGSVYRAQESKNLRLPRSHCISVDEMRFFACGPSTSCTPASPFSLRQTLCLSILTSEGDMSLYTLSNQNAATASSGPTFRRVPLGSVSRISQEQIRHRAKLSRRGVIDKEDTHDVMGVAVPKTVHNVLHRFQNISGQDGLFASLARPQWIVCERGQMVALDHRMRHASPAGGSARPVTCFGTFRNTEMSTSTTVDDFGYITIHERVGRVGSQRLTIFKGLSDVFDSNGILLGNGCCMEKVLLGVTVRRIIFIDDEKVSTGDHPLYAVLVSREVEIDQSELNTDGLSDVERQMKDQEREATKIQKQVEADLGGFDMESEWVESIERENAFHVRTELGGAPPIHQSIYSLWIVDAANKWMVIDSYELDEHEHGIDLKMMYLTEFQDETGGTTAPGYDPNNDDMEQKVRKRLFIALGTGIVNHDGEDVNTKGRVLLFNVKRSIPPAGSSTLQATTTPFAELTLAYEKSIFHGPVTTLSCLISDNDKRRLVVGAGSDINIEMWNEPQKKLIQVGFFRATMHILNIIHFKKFLLLSDAYDSLYLLVFRESDKSLTLLAKDYDPIPVYATGIMTRGAAMTFVCHDDRQNLQFFQYAPGEAAARGGNKLVCRADFHLGKQTTSFRTHYCRPSLYIHSATPASTLLALKQQDVLFGRQDDDQRIGVNFGTSDGNVISIIPLSEPIYWRLMALQSVMSNALESDCVLNHRAWRLYRRSIRRGGCRTNDRKKGVIDGDLIMKYPDLPVTQQEDLASAIGSTIELILDNLLEAQCASMIL